MVRCFEMPSPGPSGERGLKVRPMSTRVQSQVQVHLCAGAETRTATTVSRQICGLSVLL